MMIFSPLGVLRIARRMWRSITKRLLGTIGLLNLGPTGTFHFLLGLPGLRASVAAARAAGWADDRAASALAAPVEARPEAGATSVAVSAQAAIRTKNLERT